MRWHDSRWHSSDRGLPLDDLVALARRAAATFPGRCVRRFLAMSGIDRCIVLSSQAFTAFIPLLILVSTLAPVGQEDVVAESLIDRFGLSGETAAAVRQLFTTPSAASSGVGAFSALLLLFSAVSFTRRLQAMYRAAWEQESAGVRSGLFAAVGLAALVVEALVLYAVKSLVEGLPHDRLLTLPLSAAAGLVLWTSIPYLLLNREVRWRRFLVSGGIAATGTAVYGVATTAYMPNQMGRYTAQFGLFGITIVLLGWLLVVTGVIVVSAAVGAEFDKSTGPIIGRLKARYHLGEADDAGHLVAELGRATGPCTEVTSAAETTGTDVPPGTNGRAGLTPGRQRSGGTGPR
jgi:uncharacterized BrkB/YihY/UPF0761 family membrane protein